MKINPYPKLLCIMALLFLWNAMSAQQSNCKITLCKNKKPVIHTIELSPDGKIISDVPEYISWDDSIRISIKDEPKIIEGMNSEVKKILNTSLSSLQSRESQKNLVNYFYLFQESDVVNLHDDTTAFKQAIEQVRSEINGFIQGNPQSSPLKFVPKTNADTSIFTLKQPGRTTKRGKGNKVEFEYRRKTIDNLKVDWMKASKPNNWELPSHSEVLAFDSAFDIIDELVSRAKMNGITCEEAKFLKQKLISVNDTISAVLQVPLKNWLMKWIWLNGTSFKLNPFSVGENKIFDKDEKMMIESIPVFEAKLNAFKMVLEKNESLNGTTVLAITDSISSLTSALNKATTLKIELAKSTNTSPPKLFKDELLYKGHFYVSNENRKIYMRNHDAGNDYEIMGNLRKYYLDDSKVKYLVQNQTQGKETRLYESVVKVDDIAPFTALLLEPLKLIETHYKSAGFVASFDGFFFENKGKDANKPCDTIGLNNMVIRFQIARAKNNWLMEQGELQPIPELLSDETPKYRTDEAGPGKSVEAPAKVTYVLKEHVIGTPSDSISFATVDSVSYNVYSLHRFQPFAGFAFGSVKRNKLNIDGSGNLLSVEREKEQNTFMGIKIYPVKTDIHNPKFIWATGRDFWSRLNFVVGMDFTNINPVDNFIGGVGVDLVPGLNIAYYGNYYKNNTYKIEQGKFIKDGRPLMFDQGFMISLDPIVIFNFAKLIAKP